MHSLIGTPARRFAAAWGAGSALAVAGYWWMITLGTGNPLRYEPVNSDFYEAQARSFLDGRLDIAPRVLNIEAFEHGGRTYTYFPPLPALMRVPIVAFTDDLDGRLTAVFMLAAFVLALGAAGALVWRLRTLWSGHRGVGRLEAVAVGSFALLVGVGTPLFFTGSRAWVYHESGLWGAAFALCAFDQIVAYLSGPTSSRLARAGAFTAAAILSRVTVGTGPAVALGLVLVVGLAAQVAPKVAPVARSLGVPVAVTRSRRALGGLAAAAITPVAVYALVNLAKFGTPFGIPVDRQAQNFVDPHRRKVLAANDGSLFALGAIPSHVIQLLRPDAVAFRGTFPWVGVPSWRPPSIGGLLFDARQPTISVTAAMPLLVVLAAVGVVALLRARFAPVRACAIAALAVLPLTWSFLYIAQRYTIDVLPLVLMLAGAGFVVTAELLTRRTRAWRIVAVGALAVLVAAGSWTGVAVALEYQRLLAPLVPEDVRREYVGWQSDVAAGLGTSPLVVDRGGRLPSPTARGSLFVLGECDALYQSDGREWHAVERSAAGGHHRFALRVRPRPAGTVEPLLTVGAGTDATTIAVRHRADGQVVLVAVERGLTGTPFPVDASDLRELDLVVDPALDVIRVTRDSRQVLAGGYTGPRGPVALGTTPSDPMARFSGEITRLASPTDVCEEVVRRAR